MEKSTKGALAGAAAAVLLLGGFGTQAAWQAEAEVPGGDINTGHLYLTSDCGAWDLVNTLLGVTDTVLHADLANLRMVPGDVLSRLCTFTVHIEGDNLATAGLALGGTDPDVLDGSDVLSDLVASAAFEHDGVPVVDPTSVELQDGDVITAELSVGLAAGLTGLQGQDLTGVLEGLTVTVTQA